MRSGRKPPRTDEGWRIHPPRAGRASSVTWLLDNGYLVEERPTGTDAR